MDGDLIPGSVCGWLVEQWSKCKLGLQVTQVSLEPEGDYVVEPLCICTIFNITHEATDTPGESRLDLKATLSDSCSYQRT